MKVQCISKELTSDQKRRMGMSSERNPAFDLTIGREYIVLGVSFLVHSTFFGSTTVVEVQEDHKSYCTSIPLCLFRITDPRPSPSWIAESDKDMTFRLWPSEFYAEYFHDDLTEGSEEAKIAFSHVMGRLSAESDAPVGSDPS